MYASNACASGDCNLCRPVLGAVELIFGPVGVLGRRAVSVEHWLFNVNKKLFQHLVRNSFYILTMLYLKTYLPAYYSWNKMIVEEEISRFNWRSMTSVCCTVKILERHDTWQNAAVEPRICFSNQKLWILWHLFFLYMWDF